MTVGSLGDIVFSVSSNKVETLKNLKYTKSASFAEHNRHCADTILEYTGNNPAEISFDITLSYLLGVKVEKEIKKLDLYTRRGKAMKLVIGKKVYGSYLWVIEKYSVNYQHFDKSGNVVTADVSLSLKEYCR